MKLKKSKSNERIAQGAESRRKCVWVAAEWESNFSFPNFTTCAREFKLKLNTAIISQLTHKLNVEFKKKHI